MQATYILKQMDKHQMEKAIKQADNLIKREVENLLRREIDNINALGHDLANFSPDAQKALIELTNGKIKTES